MITSSTLLFKFDRFKGFEYKAEIFPDWETTMRYDVPIQEHKLDTSYYQSCTFSHPIDIKDKGYTLIISKTSSCSCCLGCKEHNVVARAVVRGSLDETVTHKVVFRILLSSVFDPVGLIIPTYTNIAIDTTPKSPIAISPSKIFKTPPPLVNPGTPPHLVRPKRTRAFVVNANSNNTKSPTVSRAHRRLEFE